MDMRLPVVVVDDDRGFIDHAVSCLGYAGITVVGFDRSPAGLHYLLHNPASVAVIDLHMPEMDGVEIVRQLRKRAPDLPIVGVTGTTDPRDLPYLEAMVHFGARAALRKPIDCGVLVGAVCAAMGRARAKDRV
jgi:two-component system response regulator ChvI